MKKKDSKPIFHTFFKRMAIPVLCLWFFSMALLTWAVARDFYLQLDTGFTEMSEGLRNVKSATNAETEINMVYNLSVPYTHLHPEPLLPIILPQAPDSYTNQHMFYGQWELFYGYQAAVGYYNKQSQPLIVSGDYLCFEYSDRLDGEPIGKTYIDMQKLEAGTELADEFIRRDPFFDFFLFSGEYTQLEGYFEGSRFCPTKITGKYRDQDAQQVYYNAENPDRETVTIYAERIVGYNYHLGSSFYRNGKYYENAVSLLQEKDINKHFGLFDSVLRRELQTDTGKTAICVIHCRPIVYAALRTWPVYLVTLLLVIIYLVWYKKFLFSRLVVPLWTVNQAYASDRVELSQYGRASYEEYQILYDHFETAQQERHKCRNQVQQLQTALDYAQNAEQSRRKMISAIAHELKTPLAVIHGYAEGLQTGIAEEKRDKYLSVILEETESMDAMVLEMLELSRLEAGKVQLSVSQFSLSALARSIFEKLAPAAESKGLQVEFDIPLEVSVAADEVRIGQVITNFATNAIKYTPENGKIRVKVQRVGDHARFSVENDSPPLCEETLGRVWDSFYRADTARDRSGTGLGLTISKNIIHLHRGTCSARNTANGVEFQFNIP